MSDDEKFSMCKELLSTMKWLHCNAKVMHRDLKPENLLCREGTGEVTRIILSDFGSAIRYFVIKISHQLFLINF